MTEISYLIIGCINPRGEQLHIHGHGYNNYGVIGYLKAMEKFMVMFNIDYETMMRIINMLIP